jgi:ABC-type Fe3+-hydroxamate transport system substrate-binding protein
MTSPAPTLSVPPRRIVSLVPSITESLFDLGLGKCVVGVTDYCIHPSQSVSSLPRVGGTKNPRLEAILALGPDLVLANQEENTPETVAGLREAGIEVWVSFPHSVEEMFQVLRQLVSLFQDNSALLRVETLERAVEWAKASSSNHVPVRFFCPIWQGETEPGQTWWMTFNQDTYCHNLLAVLGGENVFAGRERRYPLAADLTGLATEFNGEQDTRYPRITLEEITAANPGVILLPSEPFAFRETHRQDLLGLLPGVEAVKMKRVHLVDGSLITWHGTRIARALRTLPALFEA